MSADNPRWHQDRRPAAGGQERSRPGVEIVFVSESAPGNILSKPDRPVSFMHSFFNTLSAEGFAENPAGQRVLADFYISTLNLRGRGPMLDAGFGQNDHIANRFASLGIPAFALDTYTVTSQEGAPRYGQPPRIERVSDNGVSYVSGDIAMVDVPGSDLGETRFGTVLFNGSWASGGNNFTATGEMFEAKHYQKHTESPTLEDVGNEQNALLRASRAVLSDTGVLGVVSSRYANHGGGYGFDQYPTEKLSFIELYARLTKLGARKITVVGLSQDGLDQLVTCSQEAMPPYEKSQPGRTVFSAPMPPAEIVGIREQMRTPQALNVDEVFRYFESTGEIETYKRDIRDALEQAEQHPQFAAIARIDAMFAEF